MGVSKYMGGEELTQHYDAILLNCFVSYSMCILMHLWIRLWVSCLMSELGEKPPGMSLVRVNVSATLHGQYPV